MSVEAHFERLKSTQYFIHSYRSFLFWTDAYPVQVWVTLPEWQVRWSTEGSIDDGGDTDTVEPAVLTMVGEFRALDKRAIECAQFWGARGFAVRACMLNCETKHKDWVLWDDAKFVVGRTEYRI